MENIYTTVRSFYYLSKVLGVFPKSFNGPTSKGALKTKWYDILISASSFLLLLVLIVIICNSEGVIKVDSSILVRAWEISLVVGLLFLLIQVCFQLYNRNKICDFLRHLHEFDCKVGSEI